MTRRNWFFLVLLVAFQLATFWVGHRAGYRHGVRDTLEAVLR